MPAKSDLTALQNLLEQASLILSSDPMPPGGQARCRELIEAARQLAGALVESNRARPAAAALGKRGGQRTAERGPDYFRKLAAMRKTRGGGRPRKEVE